jgi:hypothetical protein
MKRALVIIEQNRPDCLWLCLQSFSKAKGLENYDVLVDIDAPCPGTDAKDFTEAISSVACNLILRETWSGGILYHWTRALTDAFNRGYEEVLFIEGDIIVRTDALAYLESAIKDQVFTALDYQYAFYPHLNNKIVQEPNNVYCGYSPRGNLINRENFLKLKHYLDNKLYAGCLWKGQVISEFDLSHDTHFNMFCRYANAYTRSADKMYSLHFGTSGINHKSPEGEKRIFAGPRENWFGNLLELNAEGSCHVLTPYFKYA